ncbi:hypothetical protein SUGI_0806120 [Cryptomeria japonica]|uniref:uncharacterized protein LOC131857394 n=1 Tax=Cryptomeria japonica TaxID=3369 RepID=UPI002414AB47|nr:uncharacterized protein LOC131857394 [Cryptomeria japonica]GLJ39459.1 hypothetical protein SUGI_0806120 [Cryptomeria japonica]
MVTGKAIVLSVLVTLSVVVRTASQLPIPPRYDGFVYKNRISADSVLVEAFFDPLCPDSRDSWWPLKEALRYYKHNITFIVHPFALPYHNNAFIASRSLHVANKINTSYTFPLLERFFRYQQNFYNKPTLQTSPATITQQIIHFALEKTGNSSFEKFVLGFQDKSSDMTTRISFKYGCSRAVTGTPYFFVNGIPLNIEETLDFAKWKSIIDPLLAEQAQAYT